MMHEVLLWFGSALSAAAMLYAFCALLAVRRRSEAPAPAIHGRPGISLLKPLCGTEAETYECLRSFCQQRYPCYEIIFGIADPADEVAAIVRRLQREHPDLPMRLVADRTQHGASRKVSNLINMLKVAQHRYLVLADSDVRVGSDYLEKLIAPLSDPTVGIVTCAYRGVPRRDWCSRLAAMFINEWFIPSVRVAAMSGSRAFAFGATIGLRREVLTAIGGFAAIADQLADDYRLGELTRGLGLRTVLSEVVVEILVGDSRISDLVRHELRWLRTIRLVRPAGYSLAFVSLGPPVGALGALLAGGARPAAAMFLAACLARFGLHVSVHPSVRSLRALIVVPLRDLLTAALWALSFTSRRVHWREWRYRIDTDGSVQAVAESQP